MAKQRKYLDRGRRIALEGRPYEVEWFELLGLGRLAAQNGRANSAPFLSEVMWEGVSSLPPSPDRRCSITPSSGPHSTDERTRP